MPRCTEFNSREASRRFIEIRTKEGLTQEELADRLGVALQTIKNYEKAGSINVRGYANGDRVNAIAGMKIETLFKMAQQFNVSADYLLGISPTISQDQSVKSIVDKLGIPEYLITFLLDWRNLPYYSGSGEELSKIQKFIVDIANELYPMQKKRYFLASEDFKFLVTYFLESVYDRPALILDAFRNARSALTNTGTLSDCSEDEWVRSFETLERSGFLAMPANDVGEWYLERMFTIMREQMQEEIERFG